MSTSGGLREARGVLLIESNSDESAMYRMALEERGFSVWSAGSAGEGLAVATTATIAAVLIEQRLPDCDGWIACGALRAGGLNVNVPILVLTSDPVDVSTRAERAGATRYLLKPYAPDRLADLLCELLDGGPPAFDS
jgi:DNA-binding response OmpR family regulator